MEQQHAELISEMMKCKLKFREDIDSIKDEIVDIRVKHDEYSISLSNVMKQLKKHELQRISFNERVTDTLNDVVGEVKALKEWAVAHDKGEMGKYEEIIKSQSKTNEELKNISKLLTVVKDETDKNTTFIDTLKKYWGRILFTSSGVVGTVGFFYWLYGFLEGHGIVIVFEKGAQ